MVVIEDAAQVRDAINVLVRAGAQGSAAVFSFYPCKNLDAFGEEGAANTNNSEIEAKVQLLKNCGFAEKYYNDLNGKNFRLDTF